MTTASIRVRALRLVALAAMTVAAGLAAGCGSSGPAYYLASSSSVVFLAQWAAPQNGQASGSLTYDSITGTAPDETIDVQTMPVNVAMDGGNITFTPSGLDSFLGTSVSGTLSGGELTITAPPDSTTGQLETDSLAASSPSAYNSAVGVLRKAISNQNARAAAAEQAQQQAQQTANDQQAVATDVTTLDSDASSLGNYLSQLGSDVSQTNRDLSSERTAASHGANADGGDCYNLEENVSYDATENVEYDATEDLGYDLQENLQPGIAAVRSDIGQLQADLSALNADGGQPTGDPQSAISAARKAIRQAVSQANADIATVNSDVNEAYSIGNSMATGSCAGMGPGPAPSPIPTLRG